MMCVNSFVDGPSCPLIIFINIFDIYIHCSNIIWCLMCFSIISISCIWHFRMNNCVWILTFSHFRTSTWFWILIFRQFIMSTCFGILILRHLRINTFFFILLFRITTDFFINYPIFNNFSILTLSLFLFSLRSLMVSSFIWSGMVAASSY